MNLSKEELKTIKCALEIALQHIFKNVPYSEFHKSASVIELKNLLAKVQEYQFQQFKKDHP